MENSSSEWSNLTGARHFEGYAKAKQKGRKPLGFHLKTASGYQLVLDPSALERLAAQFALNDHIGVLRKNAGLVEGSDGRSTRQFVRGVYPRSGVDRPRWVVIDPDRLVAH